MKSKTKKGTLFAMAMLVALASSPKINVRAEELDNNELFELSSNESIRVDEIVEVGSLEEFAGNAIEDVIIDNGEIALASAGGDIYETNNGPGLATSGRYNKLTNASIHESSDVDWYRIEVLDETKPISVFLTNIPSGCDYDMYLLQYDSNVGITNMYYNIQAGNTSESLYGTVDQIGTYYVVVQPKTSVDNNYSSSNYTLYMGDYYRNRQYGYTDTGLDISFGYIAVGNTTPVYRGWYSYDLTNETSIPDDAVVTKIYLSDTGNGAYWLGFYKMMAAGGQGRLLDEKIGQIEVMYSGDDELLAKQQWLIGGHLIASSNFVWEPQILIAYKYGATISNIRFLQ